MISACSCIPSACSAARSLSRRRAGGATRGCVLRGSEQRRGSHAQRERERRHRTRETGRGTPGHGTRDSNNIRQQRSRWGQRDIKHNHASQQRRSTAGTAGRRQSTAASSLRARAPREREQLVTAGGIIFTPPCLFCMEVLTRYTGGATRCVWNFRRHPPINDGRSPDWRSKSGADIRTISSSPGRHCHFDRK
jgi:hypothetical protein